MKTEILNYREEMRTELGSSSLRTTLEELKLKLLTEGMDQRVKAETEGQSGSSK